MRQTRSQARVQNLQQKKASAVSAAVPAQVSPQTQIEIDKLKVRKFYSLIWFSSYNLKLIALVESLLASRRKSWEKNL